VKCFSDRFQFHGVIIKSRSEILPGWILSFDEVSNNVYKVELTDNYGRQASTTDSNLEEAIETVQSYAFDIEKQITKNWNRFLYDTCIMKLDQKSIVNNKYEDEIFGSWYITLSDKRFVLDGRDYVFSIQENKDKDWIDIKSLKLSELTFENLLNCINSA
jgi:hypothetical protein